MKRRNFSYRRSARRTCCVRAASSTMAGAASMMIRQHTSPVDFNASYCAAAVPHPLDISPKRSPQAVHSLLSVLLRGRDVVEIGTRVGDGFMCWAASTRSAVASEFDKTYCRGLGRRLPALRDKTKPSLVCNSFFDTHLDADAFTWWNQAPFLTNDHVLVHLRGQRAAGKLRAGAVALPLFDLHYDGDRKEWNRLKNETRWHQVVHFDERRSCLGFCAKSCPGKGVSMCGRATGSFVVAEIAIDTYRS